jgi:hypothetical protein
MKSKFAVHMLVFGLLILATSGASAMGVSGSGDLGMHMQADTSGAKPDTVMAPADTAVTPPATPAPTAAPAVAPAAQAPAPAAAPPPATRLSPQQRPRPSPHRTTRSTTAVR